MAMNSNVLAFAEPRETSHLQVNLSSCSEMNNDDDELAFARIVGRSSGLRHVLQLVMMVGATDATVLLLGERSEGHTSELQSLAYLVCRLLLEKKTKEKSTTKDLNRDLICDLHVYSRDLA